MQPATILFPVIYAIFLWWFTTGLIIVVYDRSPLLTRLFFGGATGALILSLVGVGVTASFSDPLGVYLAVSCGIVIWGWQVAGYYLGFITGIDETSNTQPKSLRDRFWRALRSGIHHELSAAICGLLLLILTWGQPNRWGLWVYLALWLMHSSAKLNVFFGVRNFRIEFLPRHLHHLERLLSKRSSNKFFPLSIVVASTTVLVLIYRAIIPTADPTQTVGGLLIATLITLGILEHWLLILPIPVTLWGWGIRELPNAGQTALAPSKRIFSEPQIKG